MQDREAKVAESTHIHQAKHSQTQPPHELQRLSEDLTQGKVSPEIGRAHV